MKTIKLDYPIKADGREVKELTMRRPKVKDQLLSDRAGASDAEKELTLFAHLTALAPADLHELDMTDYIKLQEAYRSFLS
jgi:hypothetical protein